ncbi:DUF5519 family protein [Elizabethkingia anophelis]|nr:DUF5519 family protein [Elizabethkingia anophelis]
MKLEITNEIENIILQWKETSATDGDFGSREFLFRGKEIGHIHSNGELDISFGNKLTKMLLSQNLVQQHLYVPETSITYKVSSEEQIPFAISLLRFSYILVLKKFGENDKQSITIFETELIKLPKSLSSIYLNIK